MDSKRINYYERYQQIIDAYNSEQDRTTIEKNLMDLMYLGKSTGLIREPKAAVDNVICGTLWEKLPKCCDEISISAYRQRIYEYVYTRYKEVA